MLHFFTLALFTSLSVSLSLIIPVFPFFFQHAFLFHCHVIRGRISIACNQSSRAKNPRGTTTAAIILQRSKSAHSPRLPSCHSLLLRLPRPPRNHRPKDHFARHKNIYKNYIHQNISRLPRDNQSRKNYHPLEHRLRTRYYDNYYHYFDRNLYKPSLDLSHCAPKRLFFKTQQQQKLPPFLPTSLSIEIHLSTSNLPSLLMSLSSPLLDNYNFPSTSHGPSHGPRRNGSSTTFTHTNNHSPHSSQNHSNSDSNSYDGDCDADSYS